MYINYKGSAMSRDDFTHSICSDIYQIKENHGVELARALFEDKILKMKDASLSFYFMDLIGSERLEEHAKIVIDSGNAELNYRFATYIYGADKKTHEEIVLKAKNPRISYLFALNNEASDMKKHEQIVIESKNPEINYLFATHVKGADISAHGRVILESNNPEYCFKFAKYFERNEQIDLTPFEQVILNTKNPELCYSYARLIKKANISLHEQIVLEYGTPRTLLEFMKVPGADKEKLKIAILKSEHKSVSKVLPYLEDKTTTKKSSLKNLVRTRNKIFKKMNILSK